MTEQSRKDGEQAILAAALEVEREGLEEAHSQPHDPREIHNGVIPPVTRQQNGSVLPILEDNLNVTHSKYWDEKTQSWHFPPLTLGSLKPFSSGWSMCQRIRYLLNTVASMVSGRWYCLTIIDHLEYDAKQVLDRILSQWSNTSLVAALLVSLSYSAFSVPIANPENLTLAGYDAAAFISILSYASVGLFLIAICATILLSMGINTLPAECSLLFVQEFKYLATVPEFTTTSALTLFMITIFLAGMIQYGDGFRRCALPMLVVVGLFVILFWNAIVLILDRQGGLWDYAKQLKKLHAEKNRTVIAGGGAATMMEE